MTYIPVWEAPKYTKEAHTTEIIYTILIVILIVYLIYKVFILIKNKDNKYDRNKEIKSIVIRSLILSALIAGLLTFRYILLNLSTLDINQVAFNDFMSSLWRLSLQFEMILSIDSINRLIPLEIFTFLLLPLPIFHFFGNVIEYKQNKNVRKDPITKTLRSLIFTLFVYGIGFAYVIIFYKISGNLVNNSFNQLLIQIVVYFIYSILIYGTLNLLYLGFMLLLDISGKLRIFLKSVFSYLVVLLVILILYII